jgi:hypothetical protein
MSAVGKYRPPTREEFAVGIAELGKLIGAVEATAPDWTRRLALSEDGSTWLLMIEEAAAPTTPHLVPWADPIQLRAFPVAYLLAEAVAILQGPHNPEAILADRRARTKAHEAEVAAQKTAEESARLAKREEAEQLAADKVRFNADAWDKLTDAQRLALALALRVEARDPALATDLREIGSHRILDFPRAKWWTT